MRIQRLIGGSCLVVALATTNLAAASELADAVMNRNAAAVRTLLSQRADVNETQVDGATALHWAVKWDDAALVDQLIAAGANVNVANRFGATPMYLACVNGNAAIIERLIAAGSDPNAPLLSAKETPLMVAARTGKLDAVRVLLDKGANINASETLRGTTAAMWAAEQGHSDVIRLLASRGADLAATSTVSTPQGRRGNGDDDDEGAIKIGGLTALIFAAREGKLDAVKAIVEAGANVNQAAAGDNSSALLVAILNGHYELATYLLDRGADPNVANGKGWNPLYQAVKNRNLETGAVPLVKTGALTNELVLIQSLLDKGADPNIRMKANSQSRNGQGGTWMQENGATPFLRAALSGDVTVMKMLLPYGADPNLSTADGTTALMALAGVGFAEGFISHHTPNETMQAFRLMVDLGADVRATNRRGLSAMHGAAHRGDDQVVQALADLGAQVDLKDRSPAADGHDDSGLTPLDWALGVRISAASPIYKESTVQLITNLLRERNLPVPESALKTIGGKRSAAGTGQQQQQ
jgi:ankyrin